MAAMLRLQLLFLVFAAGGGRLVSCHLLPRTSGRHSGRPDHGGRQRAAHRCIEDVRWQRCIGIRTSTGDPTRGNAMTAAPVSRPPARRARGSRCAIQPYAAFGIQAPGEHAMTTVLDDRVGQLTTTGRAQRLKAILRPPDCHGDLAGPQPPSLAQRASTTYPCGDERPEFAYPTADHTEDARSSGAHAPPQPAWPDV